jgi:hypothetical protein
MTDSLTAAAKKKKKAEKMKKISTLKSPPLLVPSPIWLPILERLSKLWMKRSSV